MSKPDLIMCLAFNYKLEQIEPFITSWRKYMPEVELAMISSNLDAAFYSVADRFRITLIDAQPLLDLPYNPVTARFFVYGEFLRNSSKKYNSILLCDVRDVVFQGNPFSVERDQPVWFAAEDKVIGSCPINTGWLRDGYGEDIALRLAPETISCSGTTIGDAQAIAEYIELVCQQAKEHPEISHADQAYHNYILHHLRPSVIALDSRDRVINTIGYTPAELITVKNGRVLVDGVDSPVIHQWDRHPWVEAHLREEYNLKLILKT